MARPEDIKKKVKVEEAAKPLQQDTSKQDIINILNKAGFNSRNDDGVIMMEINCDKSELNEIIGKAEKILSDINYRGSYGFRYSSV